MEPRRCQPALEMHLGPQKRWNPNAQGLAEDVAQRQRMQNAQRMDESLVPHVRFGALFGRPKRILVVWQKWAGKVAAVGVGAVQEFGNNNLRGELTWQLN